MTAQFTLYICKSCASILRKARDAAMAKKEDVNEAVAMAASRDLCAECIAKMPVDYQAEFAQHGITKRKGQ